MILKFNIGVPILIKGELINTLVERMKGETRKLTHFLSSWSGAASRSFLGSVAEDLFSEFVQEIDIHVWMKGMMVRTDHAVVHLERNDGEEWSECKELYKKMAFCQLVDKGLAMVKGGEAYTYYKPSSFAQKMWDAIVMPPGTTPNERIDLIQITLGANHGLVCKEFENFFKKFPDRKFRYLMIRVAMTTHEVNSMRAATMRCSFVCPMDLKEKLSKRVEFYECVLDFEVTLKKWLEVHQVKRCNN
jgi:hypothetical protein